MTKNFDVIIIGGGAAGFFAAINCAINFPKYKIAILEKNNKVLQKVLVSGGGRCNVTNHSLDNKLLVQNYHVAKRNCFLFLISLVLRNLLLGSVIEM